MKSEEIKALLNSVREASITDKDISATLQKIRSTAMATKGGVQRLVKLGCVHYVLKLLYRYISMDKVETQSEKTASESNVNTALSIVANLLMDKDARQQVKRDGMETIVTLLTDCTSEEVKIRCCRSLSNLTIDPPACPVMAEAKAVPAVVKTLEIQYVEVVEEKAATAGSPEDDATKSERADAKDSDMDSEEVDLEPRFPSTALVEAACKVLRSIFGDNKLRQQLVEEGVVGRLAMLMKSEDARLVAAVLRTLSELWTKMNKRITENMASEFSRAGVMSKVLDLVDSEDDKTSQQAFTILLPLAGHPRSAALIGASDGVDFFLSHLDSPRRHISRKELISGMCLLAKEAVNRVKLRESDGLKVFLETLRDEDLGDVHDRVISSLVSFLYDDSSLTVMLGDGLVNILLTHLQRCGNFTSDLALNIFKSAESLMKPAVKSSSKNAGAEEGRASSALLSSESRVISSSNAVEPAEDSKDCLGRTQSEPSVVRRSLILSQRPTFNTVDHLSDPDPNVDQRPEVQSQQPQTDMEAGSCPVGPGSGDDDGGQEDQSMDEAGPARTQVYSMNSPTYQAETTWRMEDYHPGVTCKSYHLAPSLASSPAAMSEDSRASSHQPYSPISMQSYLSPSHSAGLSPHSSVTSSPAYSYATLSPVRSPCFSEGYVSPCSSGGVSSEDLAAWSYQAMSPGGVSLQEGVMSPISIPQGLVFSSSEDDDFVEEDAKQGVGSDGTTAEGSGEPRRKVLFHLGEENETPVEQRSSVDDYVQCETHEQTPGQNSQSSRFFRLHDSDGEPVAKRKMLGRGAGMHAAVTQNCILILLSRLSVRDDLSQHLASFQVLLCLTDHLALAVQPQDRCVRVLSRVLASPHCFASLLKMCAPAVLVRTFLLDAHLRLVTSEATMTSRHLSMDENETLLTGSGGSRRAMKETASSSSGANFPEESSSAKTQFGQRLSCDSSMSDLPDSGTGPRRPGPGDRKCVVQVGRTLLEDLSNQAVSPYGEGVVDYIFSCRSAAEQLTCAASLLFLHAHWLRERRQKFLIHQGALDKVLTSLCTPPATDTTIKDVLSLALVYLSRGLHLTARFQSTDVPQLMHQAVQSIRPEAAPVQESTTTATTLFGDSGVAAGGQDCTYSRAEKDLRIVVKRGSSRHVLQARREMLVSSSSVFAAMLQGSYLESGQSEISISDVCSKAMTTVLHYLHCCDSHCSVMMSLGSGSEWVKTSGDTRLRGDRDAKHSSSQTVRNGASALVKRKWLKHLLNVIAAADRFLLPDLVRYLCAVISTSLVDAGSAEQVFCFAALYGFLELAEDCVNVLLSSPSSVVDTTQRLTALAEGEFASVFRAAVMSLLKRGLASTL
ncbi:uncharacterized protein LOC143302345 [Babylonia areolata]|uniref:uncharacterized protein LOC143302345 n=1 Tax=Babylonia areolata TaxID=304850 RepID=UPI003FD2C107